MNQPKYPMAEGQTQHKPPLAMWRRAGDLIFVSGHGAVNGKGEFASDEFEVQYRHTMEALGRTLAAAGVEFSDVVNARCYVQNPADIPAHNAMYREYFSSDPKPSRTTIVSCLPPGLLFEIECVAQLKDEQ